MVPQIASLKLALLLIILDVSWIAHAVKGARAFITNVFLLMQAFKMIRQEKLPHVCELVNAICMSIDFKLHISSETPCALRVYALSGDEAEYRETCSHQHSIGCEVFFFMSISLMLQSKIEFYQQIVECRHIH